MTDFDQSHHRFIFLFTTVVGWPAYISNMNMNIMRLHTGWRWNGPGADGARNRRWNRASANGCKLISRRCTWSRACRLKAGSATGAGSSTPRNTRSNTGGQGWPSGNRTNDGMANRLVWSSGIVNVIT